MRRLEYYIILTADGFYADPDGGLGYYEPAEDEHRFANGLMRDAGDVVMSRVMYTGAMRYWDGVDASDPTVHDVEREFAQFWQDTPKHIVSHGRPELGPKADLVEGDAIEAVRQMKEGDGATIMLGTGSELFARLTAARLIDRYRFLILPVALGRGKALFRDLEAPLRLDLVGTRTFSSGSVLLEYEPKS